MSNKIINQAIKIELDREINKIKSKNNNLFDSTKHHFDLSHLKTYTIDDSQTIEIDDAISLEKIGKNFKLWIHIASPAAHIEYNSVIDRIARKSISTLYLSTNNIYMLPEILINEVFSFTKKEKRCSISLGVVLNNDGSIYSSEIVQSLVQPNYQLTYEDADELLDYAPREEEDLSIISTILEKRRSWRKKIGAKEILESYGKIIVNNNIPTVKVINPTLSRLLISEAMILYGDLLSKYTMDNNISVPYRVQENSFIIENKNKKYSDNIILHNYLLKKSMGKTYYSIIPLSHNSLALHSYLHATSPIRRYCDLLVHYQINRFLNNKCLIAKEDIEINIKQINNIGRQNINRSREDQKKWINVWFENNSSKEFKVIFLNWINRNKNHCIMYFIDFNFSVLCYLKSKLEIDIGDKIIIRNITNDYTDMLCFQLNI